MRLILAGVLLASVAWAETPLERARNSFNILSPTYNEAVPAPRLELGRALFHDPRLSVDKKLSCASCHPLGAYGMDGLALSPGHDGQKGVRNTPTVYNVGNHVALFWDGRAATLEDQVRQVVLNPVEMAMPDAAAVEKVLRGVPGYAPLFAAAFPGEPEPVSFTNAARAIAAFERSLVTPARFDDFLGGDEKALSPLELEGLVTFIDTGCATCHNGEGVGGRTFAKLGVALPVAVAKDLGRAQVTKNKNDIGVFKVASLRNVEKTAPYLHSGLIDTLPKMVEFMAKKQLNRDLTPEQNAAIVAFLKSLTGKLPADAKKPPVLP